MPGSGRAGDPGKSGTAAERPSWLDVATYRVLFADCDPMRIMYYGSYLRLFEIGRAELFRRLGHPFPAYIARGLYLSVVETRCRYHKPARYDDLLLVRAGFVALDRVRLTIGYEVWRDGELLTTGETVHVVVDEQGRPQRIPREFRSTVEGLLR
ncbi:MAG: hypothetical protein KatS3mg076_1467 [Candidatus Binatia bacterium]|nr:MAG: hypothetical protein KatS3mg076_1467 [Candidatus Binatia bacterium]